MALAIVLNRRRQVPAEDSPAFGAIAERFRRAGELERAVALCQEGLQKYPRHMSSRVTLGWALLDLGRYDEARVELEQVLKRAPDNLAAIRGLAQLHDRTEHDDVAAMQSEPSRWAVSDEEVGLDPADADSGDFALPEQAAIAESLEADPSPWMPVQDDSAPVLAMPAELAAISEADALAAELLASGPQLVQRAPAAPVRAEDIQLWCDEGVEPAAEHIEPAPLLELVPASAFSVDDGFIPDEGPGPWPPVFEDEDPALSSPPALRLAHGNAGVDWPPRDRPAVQCAPAVAVLSEVRQAPAPQTIGQTGLLSALSKFRRRVDARRKAVVSEYVAG